MEATFVRVEALASSLRLAWPSVIGRLRSIISRMPPIGRELGDSAEIFRALGQLALAASQAESHAAQGLFYLLSDSPGDEEGAARIAGEFRSFNSLHRLLSIALRGDTPLTEILATARSDAQKRNADGDRSLVAIMAEMAAAVAENEYLEKFAGTTSKVTAVDYLNKVKALYDKRNECIHALGVEAVGHETHLYKRKKDGTKAVVDAQYLMEPCIELCHYPGISIASAIEGLSLELMMASMSLILLPMTIQWFRRRGTPLDHAPLVDHYLALAMQPLDAQIAMLKETEAILQAKIDAYHAGKSAPPDANDAHD